MGQCLERLRKADEASDAATDSAAVATVLRVLSTVKNEEHAYDVALDAVRRAGPS